MVNNFIRPEIFRLTLAVRSEGRLVMVLEISY
jgi:hypothetical protein